MIRVTRETKETSIALEVGFGGGNIEVKTDDAFLSHMVEVLGYYAGLSLKLEATGDLKHHLIEDVAIVIGRGLAELRPETCVRFAEETLPMDDALVQVCLDLGERPYYEGPLPVEIYDHFFRSLTMELRATVHVRVIRGRNRHHMIEAAIKGLGRCFATASADGSRTYSTKGRAKWQIGSKS